MSDDEGAGAGRKEGSTRRDELLDLIISQLMTTGLDNLSLRRLASEIGTSHRMLIYHFGSREELISDAVQEVRRRERTLFESREVEFDPEDPIGPLMDSFRHNTSPEMSPYFRLFYQVWGIALVNPERYGRFLEGIITTWVDAFAKVLRQSGFSAHDARVRATLALGALRGLQLDLYTSRDRRRVNAAFETLMEMLHREVMELQAAAGGEGAASGSGASSRSGGE